MTPNTRAISPCSRKPALFVPPTRQIGAPIHRNASVSTVCPQTARRRDHPRSCLSKYRAVSRPWSTARSLVCALICGLLFCGQSVQASSAGVYGSISFDAELVFDRSEPPQKPRMGLHARQDDSSTSPTSTAGSAGSTSSGSPIATATSSSSADLPQPFDSSLGNNFTTQACPNFFNSFLNNQTFEDCLPFSLLLQTSTSFFNSLRSPVTLVRTLDASCNVDYPQCSALLSSLSNTLQTACSSDLSLQNPLVVQANAGLLAYDTLYQAACLQNTETGNYCFADAVTNASAPTSSYIYYLPLGAVLPQQTRPACTTCLQDTMALFANAASNASNPISGDYEAAAGMVDATCGANFVQTSVAKGASARSATAGTSIGILTLAAVVIAAW